MSYNLKGYENFNGCKYSGRVITKGNPKKFHYRYTRYESKKCKFKTPIVQKKTLFEKILDYIKNIFNKKETGGKKNVK